MSAFRADTWIRPAVATLAGLAMLLAPVDAALEPGTVAAAPVPPGTLGSPRETSVVGARFDYVVAPGDSLTALGARFGVDPATIARGNGLSGSAWLRVGQRLAIDNRHVVPVGPRDGILINVPQRMLFRFAEGELREYFPVGLGRPSWQTPLGTFNVRERQQDKVWRVPESIQQEMHRLGTFIGCEVPPGPENPLGRHWLGLSIPSIGIHGTIAPASIYQFQTHGCIRLQPEAAAELYDRVQVGDRGEIVYRPVLLGRTLDGRIVLEVHPDVYQRSGDPLVAARALARADGLEAEIDWAAAEAVVQERAGIARDVRRVSDRLDAGSAVSPR
jgi:L,D-transpeptidase ErfK/SrfK